MAFTLPALPYAYDALEPHIDAQTMEIHYTKHHQTYINNLNAAVEGTEFAEWPVEKLVAAVQQLPEKLRAAVINQGGGHANHSLFWEVMAPHGGGKPEGTLARAIDEQLGGLDSFKEAFTKAALTRFGSGWAWLSVTAAKDPGRGKQWQPGQPVDERQYADPRPGCLGTRLLPAVSEPPSGIHQRVLQRDQLARSCCALSSCTGLSLI